jgi:hypothetical protein
MRYLILTDQDVSSLTVQLMSDPTFRHEDRVLELVNQLARSVSSHGGGGDREIDLSALESVARDLNSKIATAPDDEDRDRVEGWISGRVFDALKQVPMDILDDEKFWTYLAARYFWRFICWREESALVSGNIETYFKGSKGADSIPLRLYLRSQAVVRADGGHDLEDAVSKGTDFWRSHVLRVRVGRARRLARTLVTTQRDDRMSTPVLRQVARRINRLWANLVLYEYDEAAASRLLSEIRSEVEANQIADGEGVSSPA